MIQLVCHHYNPYPHAGSSVHAGGQRHQNETDFGPYQFLTDKVLAKLNNPVAAALRRRSHRRGLDGP